MHVVAKKTETSFDCTLLVIMIAGWYVDNQVTSVFIILHHF